jgi:hypothetical protein
MIPPEQQITQDWGLYLREVPTQSELRQSKTLSAHCGQTRVNERKGRTATEYDWKYFVWG